MISRCIGLHGKPCYEVSTRSSLLCPECEIEHRAQANRAREASEQKGLQTEFPAVESKLSR